MRHGNDPTSKAAREMRIYNDRRKQQQRLARKGR